MAEEFWKIICLTLPLMKIVFVMIVALILLSLFTVPFIRAGTATYYIFLINIPILLGSLAANVYILYRCSQAERS